jgi:hypothetical protein
MSYEASGDGDAGLTSRTELKRFSTLDDRSGGVLSGYSTFSSMKNVEPIARPIKSERPRLTSPPNILARRDAIRRGLLNARDVAESMEIYSKAGDRMELSIAGFRLKDLLNDLWELRSTREDDWGDLLNILQGAIAQEEFETFSSEQCYAIHTIIADHLGCGAVDIDDIEKSVNLLRKAGLDPWKGISGTLHSDED